MVYYTCVRRYKRIQDLAGENAWEYRETLVSLYTSSGFEPFFLEVCTEILGTTVLSDDAPLTKCSDFVSDLRSLQEILISFVIFCTRSGIG